MDQIYLYFLPDLAAKLESYSSWGHHQMLDPNKYARVSRFCSQTKTNLLNINSINLNTEILEE